MKIKLMLIISLFGISFAHSHYYVGGNVSIQKNSTFVSDNIFSITSGGETTFASTNKSSIENNQFAYSAFLGMQKNFSEFFVCYEIEFEKIINNLRSAYYVNEITSGDSERPLYYDPQDIKLKIKDRMKIINNIVIGKTIGNNLNLFAKFGIGFSNSRLTYRVTDRDGTHENPVLSKKLRHIYLIPALGLSYDLNNHISTVCAISYSHQMKGKVRTGDDFSGYRANPGNKININSHLIQFKIGIMSKF